MQFTAEHAEWGRVDITLEDLGCGRSWEEIHRVRSVELACPECGGQVHARVSKLGTRHIYHRSRPPSCSLAAESLEHHLLKLELVTHARAAGFRAELEVAAPTGEWRADVMVFNPDGTRLMALEAQLSPITVEDIAARTGLYERDGVAVGWFAGLARFRWDRGTVHIGRGSWWPVEATLADAVAWIPAGRVVPYTPRSGNQRVTGAGWYEWAEGWTKSWNDSWRQWWTAPS